MAEYMREVLYHPVGGFYSARGDTAIGRGGHFITSPEISVLFGEVWQPVYFMSWATPPQRYSQRSGSLGLFPDMNQYYLSQGDVTILPLAHSEHVRSHAHTRGKQSW